jgi:hypothetical protein
MNKRTIKIRAGGSVFDKADKMVNDIPNFAGMISTRRGGNVDDRYADQIV